MEETLTEKSGFLNKLQNSVFRQIVFFVGSMVLLLALYIPANVFLGWKFLVKTVAGLSETKDFTIVTSVEEVNFEDSKSIIKGWVLSEKSKNERITVSLLGDDGSEIVLKTKSTQREDVSSVYNPQWDFGEIGYEAKLDGDQLKKDVCYQICVSLDYVVESIIEDKVYWVKERTKIGTERYLYNQELYRYNPTTFYEPMLTDNEFINAVTQGSLCVFDKDYGIWIYEHDHSLYYIMPNGLFGDIEKQTEIALYAVTTRPEKLPMEMREYGREYICYYPSERDINLEKETGYFLYKIPFEPDYPITYIDTGIYYNSDKEWKWKCSFRYN